MKNLDLKIGDIVKLRNGKHFGYFIYTGEKLYFGDGDNVAPVNLNNIIEIKRPNQKEIEEFGKKIETTVWKKETPNMWGDLTYPEAHKKMFMAIANGEVKSKLEWLEKTSPTSYYSKLENNCFACEAAKRRKEEVETNLRIVKNESGLPFSYSSEGFCKYCPLSDEEDDDELGRCLNGLYYEFCSAVGFKRFKLAYEIANLEWKEKK